MFCNRCGKKLNDGAKFCPYCGAPAAVPAADSTPVTEPVADSTPVTEPAADSTPVTEPVADSTPAADAAPAAPTAPAAPVYTAPAAPVYTGAPAPRKSRAGLIIGIIAGCVAVVALVVTLLVTGVFASPKATVMKALLKSAAAYSKVYEGSNAPALMQLLEEQKFSEKVGLTFTELSDSSDFDLSVLEGFGLDAAWDVDIPGEKLGISLSARYGSTELASAYAAAVESSVFAGSPEFLGAGKSYGVDTAQLGRFLQGLYEGEDIGFLGNLSFNSFEVAQVIVENFTASEDNLEALEAAQTQLLEAITVQKQGKASLEVNGYNTDCTAYQVEIPRAATQNYLNALVTILCDRDSEKVLMEMYHCMGLTESDSRELIDQVSPGASNLDEMLTRVEYLMAELGDIPLTVYVHDGYAVAVLYRDEVEDADVTLNLYMGGGKTFADDLSVVFTLVDEYTDAYIKLTSSGNHTGSDGQYTDKTTLKMKDFGETIFNLTSEMRYAPKEKEDNFSWTMTEKEALGLKLSAEGQLDASKKAMVMDLEKLALTLDDVMLFTMELQFELGEFRMNVTPDDPIMITDMDADALSAWVDEVSETSSAAADDVLAVLEAEMSPEDWDTLYWTIIYLMILYS